MQTISQTAFHMYQWLYICPGINKFYCRKQVIIVFLQFQNAIYFEDYALQEYKYFKLIVAEDGRCDTPGSSAKFCSYSLMDVSTSKVLYVETIDKGKYSFSPQIWKGKVSNRL